MAISLSLAVSAPSLAYDPAKQLAPNPKGSFYDQGRIETSRGNWNRAADLFQRAVAENPRNYKAYTLLGYSLRHAGRVREAIEAYNRALALNPSYAEAFEYRAQAHVRLGNRPAAMRDYRALVRLGVPEAEDVKRLIASMPRWKNERAN
ncbi:MAG: tetratricopeptide repeat protein [bacterium]|nr:tetratricopeptide repeat protein [bacterium]